jgi:hypothetical protein
MSAIIKIGSNTPVDALPPKIMARVGTTIIETPGTPVLDMPIKTAHSPISAHWVYDNDIFRNKPCILIIFWFESFYLFLQKF